MSTPTTAPTDDQQLHTELAAAIRAGRERTGVSIEKIAEVTSLSADKLRSAEAGEATLSVSEYVRLNGILGSMPDWFGGGTPATLGDLNTHAAALGCFTEAAPLLGWAQKIYRLADILEQQSSGRVIGLSSPTTPPGRRPALAAAQPPVSGAPYVERYDNGMDYPAHGIALAGCLRSELEEATGIPDAAWTVARPEANLSPAVVSLADHLGVAIGAAPTQTGHETSWLKAQLLLLGGTAMVLYNSRFNEAVTNFSVAHLLGHFVAGDGLGPTIRDIVEETDDHSIHSCSGATYATCDRARAFAVELLLPEDLVRERFHRDTPAGIHLSIRDLARSQLMPHAEVITRLWRLGLLDDDEAADLPRAFARRAPFGGRARNGARHTVFSEDQALPGGSGGHLLPAGLREATLGAWESGEMFFLPALLAEDDGVPAETWARIRREDDERSGARAHDAMAKLANLTPHRGA